MSKFVNVFSLSVYRDRIALDAEYKQQLLEAIVQAASRPADATGEGSAWLGDIAGHEFLFQHPLFAALYDQISRVVLQYTQALGLNNEAIVYYFQRSWATVTRRGERIHAHAHEQSNISFAYYLSKPPHSGGIEFITEQHPNELSPGLFSPQKDELGLIKQPGLLTWNRVQLDPKEDDIVVFPSKTQHATMPSQSDQPRVSISADITMMLRDSRGHETMMPHFSHWRPLGGQPSI